MGHVCRLDLCIHHFTLFQLLTIGDRISYITLVIPHIYNLLNALETGIQSSFSRVKAHPACTQRELSLIHSVKLKPKNPTNLKISAVRPRLEAPIPTSTLLSLV